VNRCTGKLLDNHDRPLSLRGQRAAAALALALERRGNLPGAILCSTAVRARETLERVAGKVALPEARFERELYLATSRTLLERLEHNLPTGALVTLRFEASCWRNWADGSGELIELFGPRDRL